VLLVICVLLVFIHPCVSLIGWSSSSSFIGDARCGPPPVAFIRLCSYRVVFNQPSARRCSLLVNHPCHPARLPPPSLLHSSVCSVVLLFAARYPPLFRVRGPGHRDRSDPRRLTYHYDNDDDDDDDDDDVASLLAARSCMLSAFLEPDAIWALPRTWDASRRAAHSFGGTCGHSCRVMHNSPS